MLTIIRLDRFFSEESRDHGLGRRKEGKEKREKDAGYLKMRGVRFWEMFRCIKFGHR